MLSAKKYSTKNFTKSHTCIIDISKDVFVESITSGKPVSGAKISVLGKNGQPIDSKYTSSDGKVSFYNLDSYTHAQAPTVIIAKKGENYLANIQPKKSERVNRLKEELVSINQRSYPRCAING